MTTRPAYWLMLKDSPLYVAATRQGTLEVFGMVTRDSANPDLWWCNAMVDGSMQWLHPTAPMELRVAMIAVEQNHWVKDAVEKARRVWDDQGNETT